MTKIPNKNTKCSWRNRNLKKLKILRFSLRECRFVAAFHSQLHSQTHIAKERDRKQCPAKAGVGFSAPWQDPVRRSLEHVEMTCSFREFRHNLYGGGGGADQRDALTFQRDVVIPLGGMP